MSEAAKKSLFSLKKSVATLEPKTPLPIASAFGHDSDDDDDAPKDPKEMFYKTYGSTKAKLAVEKAYAENPEIYAYDEEYDNFKKKSKKTEEQEKADEEKKPKYAEALMKAHQKRELHKLIHDDHVYKKEREKEQGEFADKDVFITEAYRKKIEERNKFRQEVEREDAIDSHLESRMRTSRLTYTSFRRISDDINDKDDNEATDQDEKKPDMSEAKELASVKTEVADDSQFSDALKTEPSVEEDQKPSTSELVKTEETVSTAEPVEGEDVKPAKNPAEEKKQIDGEEGELDNEDTEEHEMVANAQILEIVGDLHHADERPPDNVLFVCKLNPITTDEDLEVIFSRFGKINCCEIIRDRRTGSSLQYAFIEFDEPEFCEAAFIKMDNVLIDDRRIHVDFSQSVAKNYQWKRQIKQEKPSLRDAKREPEDGEIVEKHERSKERRHHREADERDRRRRDDADRTHRQHHDRERHRNGDNEAQRRANHSREDRRDVDDRHRRRTPEARSKRARSRSRSRSDDDRRRRRR